LLAVDMHRDVLAVVLKHGKTIDGEEIFRAVLEICLVASDMIILILAE
jgi:hypothetical protein